MGGKPSCTKDSDSGENLADKSAEQNSGNTSGPGNRDGGELSDQTENDSSSHEQEIEELSDDPSSHADTTHKWGFVQQADEIGRRLRETARASRNHERQRTQKLLSSTHTDGVKKGIEHTFERAANSIKPVNINHGLCILLTKSNKRGTGLENSGRQGEAGENESCPTPATMDESGDKDQRMNNWDMSVSDTSLTSDNDKRIPEAVSDDIITPNAEEQSGVEATDIAGTGNNDTSAVEPEFKVMQDTYDPSPIPPDTTMSDADEETSTTRKHVYEDSNQTDCNKEISSPAQISMPDAGSHAENGISEQLGQGEDNGLSMPTAIGAAADIGQKQDSTDVSTSETKNIARKDGQVSGDITEHILTSNTKEQPGTKGVENTSVYLENDESGIPQSAHDRVPTPSDSALTQEEGIKLNVTTTSEEQKEINEKAKDLNKRSSSSGEISARDGISEQLGQGDDNGLPMTTAIGAAKDIDQKQDSTDVSTSETKNIAGEGGQFSGDISEDILNSNTKEQPDTKGVENTSVYLENDESEIPQSAHDRVPTTPGSASTQEEGNKLNVTTTSEEQKEMDQEEKDLNKRSSSSGEISVKDAMSNQGDQERENAPSPIKAIDAAGDIGKQQDSTDLSASETPIISGDNGHVSEDSSGEKLYGEDVSTANTEGQSDSKNVGNTNTAGDGNNGIPLNKLENDECEVPHDAHDTLPITSDSTLTQEEGKPNLTTMSEEEKEAVGKTSTIREHVDENSNQTDYNTGSLSTTQVLTASTENHAEDAISEQQSEDKKKIPAKPADDVNISVSDTSLILENENQTSEFSSEDELQILYEKYRMEVRKADIHDNLAESFRNEVKNSDFIVIHVLGEIETEDERLMMDFVRSLRSMCPTPLMLMIQSQLDETAQGADPGTELEIENSLIIKTDGAKFAEEYMRTLRVHGATIDLDNLIQITKNELMERCEDIAFEYQPVLQKRIQFSTEEEQHG